MPRTSEYSLIERGTPWEFGEAAGDWSASVLLLEQGHLGNLCCRRDLARRQSLGHRRPCLIYARLLLCETIQVVSAVLLLEVCIEVHDRGCERRQNSDLAPSQRGIQQI